MGHDRAHCSGFTLVEVIAAFAIASVIIFATAALLNGLALPFDRGTNRVAGGERLAIAAERLATDIASAGFVLQKTSAGVTTAFAGAPARLVFIAFEGADAGPRLDRRPSAAQEVVSLTLEAAGDATRLVRRRAAWSGARMPFADAALGDDVALLEGAFEGHSRSAGHARRRDELGRHVDRRAGLPRLLRLPLRDRVTGGDMLGGADFVIRADAPPSLRTCGSRSDCLTGGRPARRRSPGRRRDPRRERRPRATAWS